MPIKETAPILDFNWGLSDSTTIELSADEVFDLANELLRLDAFRFFTVLPISDEPVLIGDLPLRHECVA